MTLGEKIRDARKSCGLSQEQLAQKMCVSRSAIAKWETDKGLPDVGNLKLLAQLLNVSVDHLLDESEPEESPILRERYQLSEYGRGCKKVQKDRVVRHKFPQARIYALLGRPVMPQAQAAESRFGVAPCRSGAAKEPDREFYLVEQAQRHYLVTVTDEYVLTRPLERLPDGGSFVLEGWCFARCNYEVE